MLLSFLRPTCRLTVLLLVLAITSFAAPGSTQIDFFSYPTREIDRLLLNSSSLFVSYGIQEANALGGLVLAGFIFSRFLVLTVDMQGVIARSMKYMIVIALLVGYTTPLPLFGVPASMLFADEARQIAGFIDASVVNALSHRLYLIRQHIETPSLWDPIKILTYVGVWLNLSALEVMLFGMNALGYLAMGYGVLIGPLFIPWFMTETFSWLFWSWFRFMLVNSFFRVTSAAVVAVWGRAICNFVDDSVAGRYDLAHFAVILPYFVMFNLSAMLSIFSIPALTLLLFSGHGHSGGGGIFNVIAASIIRRTSK